MSDDRYTRETGLSVKQLAVYKERVCYYHGDAYTHFAGAGQTRAFKDEVLVEIINLGSICSQSRKKLSCLVFEVR